jgi:Zn-dependent peptidase ImmA (M78 family)
VPTAEGQIWHGIRDMATGVQRRGRIDDRTLIQLLARDQKSQAECATYFGVSEQAVSQRLRVLGHLEPPGTVAERQDRAEQSEPPLPMLA